MNTTITVTQEDINQGVRRKCDSCPIALAINRILRMEYKSSCFAHVYIKNRETGGVIYRTIPLPDIAFNFILNFDRKEEVYPITFTLDIPKEYLKITV